jgi:hypothetical protein
VINRRAGSQDNFLLKGASEEALAAVGSGIGAKALSLWVGGSGCWFSKKELGNRGVERCCGLGKLFLRWISRAFPVHITISEAG